MEGQARPMDLSGNKRVSRSRDRRRSGMNHISATVTNKA
jgi:hypothetical protein